MFETEFANNLFGVAVMAMLGMTIASGFISGPATAAPEETDAKAPQERAPADAVDAAPDTEQADNVITLKRVA